MEQRSSRLLAGSDRMSLIAPFETEEKVPLYPPELSKYLSDFVYFSDPWHTPEFFVSPKEEQSKATWRNKERLKTVGVALVMCLNIGTDPPESIKPNPCARKEAWVDPIPSQKKKSLEVIGNSLQKQYEKWQSKAKFKQCLDPTPDELHRVCMNLRKNSKSERVLFHYNGHGTPRPTRNGELWVFGKNYTHYMPIPVSELRAWLGEPAIFVLDCCGAGSLLPHFMDSASADGDFSRMTGIGNSLRQTSSPSLVSGPTSTNESSVIVLASCRSDESLPVSPLYPADIFTACLTTPVQMALRWFYIQNPLSMNGVSSELVDNIPGQENDRKTPKGELNWIFTAVTDTIAWNTLPSATFQKMFRQDLLVASLFRNFLLAKRILKSLGCTPQSIPAVPDTTTHPLWQSWDIACEMCLMHVAAMQKGVSMVDPRNNISLGTLDSPTFGSKPASSTPALASSGTEPSTATAAGSEIPSQSIQYRSTFFTDHLTAFEIWLEFDSHSGESPAYLPIILQVLLSQTHRLRALQLLKRYLSHGSQAINLSLLVGIYPYILKLIQSPGPEIREVLVSIWAAIIGYDTSCRQELIREKSQSYFINYLSSKSAAPEHRCLAAFVLAEICNGNQEGRVTCLQAGLHRCCSNCLTSPEVIACNDLKKWICLCIFKLCEDFLWAKFLCITETGHPQLYPLLGDADPMVRACAVLALGELFGSSMMPPTSTNQLSAMSPPRQGPSSQQSLAPNSHTRASSGISSPFNPMASTTSSLIVEVPTAPTAIPEQSRQLIETELLLAIQLLESCTDCCVMVRMEAVGALRKFVMLPVHSDCIKIVVAELRELVRVHEQESSNSPSHHVSAFSPVGVPSAPSVSQLGANLNNSAAFGIPGGTAPDLPSQQALVLSPLKIEEIVLKLDDYLERLGMNVGIGFSPTNPDSGGSGDVQHSKSVEMARYYVRLWLALQEVSGKDPHPQVAGRVYQIIEKINSELEKEESLRHQDTAATEKSPELLAPSTLRPGEFEFGEWASGYGGGGLATMAGFPSNLGKSPANPAIRVPPATSQLSLIDETQSGDGNAGQDGVNENANNYLYNWSKQFFLAPDMGYDPFDDPLSVEAQVRVKRESRLAEMVQAHRTLSQIFREIDEKMEILEKKPKDEKQAAKATMVAALPVSVSKFEEKNLISIDNASKTTLVIFHPFQDVLATSDGQNIGIWSVEGGNRILNINGKQPVKRSLSSDRDLGQGGKLSTASTYSSSAFSPTVEGRITAMQWINESYESLLLVGSDDGSVRIWRDDGDSEFTASGNQHSSFIHAPAPSGSGTGPTASSFRNLPTSEGISLSSAFTALPDIDDISAGSGMVVSWLQQTGALAVGGNSKTIRLWDLGSEQCSRIFHTGHDTCTTVLNAKTISPDLHLNYPLSYQASREAAARNMQTTWNNSLIFAGFADGSVAVFDERVQSNGGRVHFGLREHNSWIVSAHCRADVPEIISASVQGTVKFSDLRSMRSYKKLVVLQRNMMSSVAVHSCAPIIATGSREQFIKILTFGGEQLGKVHKYHSGFVGQRIGPVSCLAFHPTRLLLAAGATDNIVSLYCTTEAN